MYIIWRAESAFAVVLQCGGSDAFSGVSGNPLAAWVGKQIIRHGGMVGMAETDELIGAETYFLKKVTAPSLMQPVLYYGWPDLHWRLHLHYRCETSKRPNGSFLPLLNSKNGWHGTESLLKVLILCVCRKGEKGAT